MSIGQNKHVKKLIKNSLKGIDIFRTKTYNKMVDFGGVAQLARACGSYPQCQGFKSLLRYLFLLGPLVKRLRRGPLTAETRVRFPYGSLSKLSSKKRQA